MLRKAMDICEEFASISHLDCGNCHSENVVLTGSYKVGKTSFYVEVNCKSCGKISDCGDGEFLTEVAAFDGERFIPLVKEKQITNIQRRVIEVMGEWDSERLSGEFKGWVVNSSEKELNNRFFDDVATEEEYQTGIKTGEIKKRIIDGQKQWEASRLMDELKVYFLNSSDEYLENLYFDDIATEEEYEKEKLSK